MRTLHTDAVVIGSGCAGAAAAHTLAAAGLKTLVLEKSSRTGGPVRGANGPFAVATPMQKAMQLPFGVKEAFNLHMDYTHWRVDARLVSDFINRSADTIAWLEGMGVRFSDVVAYFKGALHTWHFKDPEGPHITDAIIDDARRWGLEVITGVRCERLVYSDGRVTGVSACDADGEPLHVEAGAVVIATGGFGGNADWIRQHTGLELGKTLFSFAFPDVQGDGIRMAWEAGAGKSEMIMQTYVCLPEPYWGPGGTAFELGTFRQPGLMLNMEGERFMNEEVMANPAYAANAVRRQPDGCALMICDAGVARYYQDNDWDLLMSKLPVTRSGDLGEAVRKARAEGYQHLFVADTLDELAAQVGMDAALLRNGVDEYNRLCEAGVDTVFHKDIKYLKPVAKGPYYAARFYLGGYGSLGGIRVDHRCRVVNERGRRIPGLFAAGRDINNIYGDTYLYAMSGNDSSFDYNTGRQAGEEAARSLAAADIPVMAAAVVGQGGSR